MATLDFPIGPSINDRFPNPAIAGQPQYVWDGEKWTTVAAGVTSATPAAATPLEDNATPQIGVTTKYAREDHVHPSTALKYSAQTLTTAQQAQSRKNLYAAPFDALAYSGLQINGGFEVNQELGAAGITTSGYFCDGWRFDAGASTLAFTAKVWPSNPLNTPGFSKIFALNVTTAQAAIAGGEYVMLRHCIEGYRIARLAWGTASAQPLTIAFWSLHHRAGLYGGSVRNGITGTRCYAFTYTQNVADVPQYNVITIPGDTTGTWVTDNTPGIVLTLAVAMGSISTAPSANTWIAGNFAAAPGQINGVAATSDVFSITGVVVLPGIEAPSAERSPLIMRPYGQELLTCMRYWEKGAQPFFYLGGSLPAAALAYDEMRFVVPKRASPTMTQAGWRYYSNATDTACTVIMTPASDRFTFSLTGAANWNGWHGSGTWTADARL